MGKPTASGFLRNRCCVADTATLPQGVIQLSLFSPTWHLNTVGRVGHRFSLMTAVYVIFCLEEPVMVHKKGLQ